MSLQIGPADPRDASVLSGLVLRSKAHWGYDADFLERCAVVLRIEPEACARGDILVATQAGRPLGVAGIRMPEAAEPAMLELLFVEPEVIGSGVGAALFDAIVTLLRDRGIRSFDVVSDPHAAPFYERMGARRVGETPSEAMPGRLLPLFRFGEP